MRCCPRRTTITTPTLRSTPRCFETVGCPRRSRATTSFTVHSRPSLSKPMISRRRGSATALKTSVIVAARAIGLQIYSYIGIYVKPCHWDSIYVSVSVEIAVQPETREPASGSRRQSTHSAIALQCFIVEEAHPSERKDTSEPVRLPVSPSPVQSAAPPVGADFSAPHAAPVAGGSEPVFRIF